MRHVTIMSHGEAVAAGPPRELVAEHAGARRVEVYGAPARLREVERERGRAACARGAPARASRSSAARRNGDAARRRARAGEPRGRLRAADRRGDRMSAHGHAPPSARPDGSTLGARRRARRARSSTSLVLALDDVLVDRRADDLPARVRLRLRLDRLDGRRLRLRRVRRHRDGRDRGAVLERVPGACSGRSSSTSSSAPTTRSSRRRSTPRSSSPARRCGIARARGHVRLRADARRDRVRAGPGLGMLLVPFIDFVARLRLGARRDLRSPALLEVDRELQLHHERGADAAVPRRGHVLPARRAARVGAGRSAQLNPLYHSSSSCATRCSARTGSTSGTSLCIVAFGAGDVAPGDLADGAEPDRVATGERSARYR